MNIKKINIIIIISLLFLVVGTVLFFIIRTNSTETKIIKKQKEWGIENQKELATKAAEAFTLQDNFEPKTIRQNRLIKYFSKESPVYDYPLENNQLGVTLSRGTVESVDFCEEQEGPDLCLLLKVKNQFTKNGSVGTKTQNYWLTIIETTPGNFKAYDIGLWIE